MFLTFSHDKAFSPDCSYIFFTFIYKDSNEHEKLGILMLTETISWPGSQQKDLRVLQGFL